MLLVIALAPFVVLATRVVANPLLIRDATALQSLSISKHINPDGENNPVQSDSIRINGLIKGNQLGSSTSNDTPDELPLKDSGPSYVASIGVGNPPTNYNLIVDTGSAHTWVGANAPYVRTNTSVNISETVNVKYGSGSFQGNMVNDTVTVAPGLAASQQPISVSFNSSGVSPNDGILGIGPRDLTLGTVRPDNTTVIPTVTDTLFAQGKIKQNLVAVSFEPTNSTSVVNGELTFGDTDPTKYIGDISYFPITESFPSGIFWGIDASIQYGSANKSANASASVSIADTTAGFVDTGTTLLYLSSDAYNKYVNATGAVLDGNTRLPRISNTQYESLQSLFFVIGNSTFELTPNAQIWPRARNLAIGGDTNSIYLAISNLGNISPGVNFICGMTFLERFYSVFDTGNRRVGLATTPFTNATTN